MKVAQSQPLLKNLPANKMPELRAIVNDLITHVTGTPAVEIMNSTPPGFVIPKEHLISVCHQLHQHSGTYFDMLSNVTGVDHGPETGTMEVLYHLYSIPFHASIVLKVILPREGGEIESLVPIWKSANWLEREVFDMFGIRFINHPDLRRILMPADWIGFPLRKDYHHEETYRGIKIDY